MALSGLLLATRSPRFLIAAALSFLIFGTLMNFLASSTAAFDLFWATDAAGKWSLVWDSFLANFGIGRNFWDWILLFGIALLQGILIGLMVYVWQKRRNNTKRERLLAGVHNSDNLQSVGLTAGLAVLGSGCPTCGTTLLMPIIGTIFSSGGYVFASVLSGLLTAGAIILALFTFKRLGKDAYVLALSEHYQQNHPARSSNHPSQPTSQSRQPNQEKGN